MPIGQFKITKPDACSLTINEDADLSESTLIDLLYGLLGKYKEIRESNDNVYLCRKADKDHWKASKNKTKRDMASKIVKDLEKILAI